MDTLYIITVRILGVNLSLLLFHTLALGLREEVVVQCSASGSLHHNQLLHSITLGKEFLRYDLRCVFTSTRLHQSQEKLARCFTVA